MIVSGTWWKRVEASLKLVALLPLLALGGCGLDQLLFGKAPVEPPPEPLPPTRSNGPQGDVTAGLAPLPTQDQVRAAVPFGRTDPFAPFPVQAPATSAGGAAAPTQAAASAARSASAASPGAAPSVAGPASSHGASSARAGSSSSPTVAAAVPALAPPPGFQLTGVLRSGSRAEALVTYGAASGSLRLGDRGGKTTALLPSGWALASIQFGAGSPGDSPSVTLQNAGRKVRVRL